MNFSIKQILRFQITIQTVKDYWKSTLILTLLFAGMSIMYAGMYPAFKDTLPDVLEGFGDQFAWLEGVGDMGTYIGFLNVELYQIFWLLILAMIIGFISASIISKEVESKTMDVLMSNPVSRMQIVCEKFIGLIPGFLLINFVTLAAILGITVVIGEEADLWFITLTHIVSIPYFLSIISIGLFISTIIDEKMKASILMMSLIVGLYIFNSIAGMIPDAEALGYISLSHYFNPYDTLKFGDVDLIGTSVLIVITCVMVILSMVYFEFKEIKV